MDIQSNRQLDEFLLDMVDSIGYVNISLAVTQTGLLPINIKAGIRRLDLPSNEDVKYMGIWSKWQVDALKKHYEQLSHAEIAKLIGQNECYVKSMCTALKLKGKARIKGNKVERMKFIKELPLPEDVPAGKIKRPPASYSNKRSVYGLEY